MANDFKVEKPLFTPTPMQKTWEIQARQDAREAEAKAKAEQSKAEESK